MIRKGIAYVAKRIDHRINGKTRIAHFAANSTLPEPSIIAALAAFGGATREVFNEFYWHGTCWQIPDGRFAPFSHFGTARQAGLNFAKSATDVYRLDYENSTWRQKLAGVITVPEGASEGAIFKIRLNMRQPLRISDGGVKHDLDGIAALIDETGILRRRVEPLIQAMDEPQKGAAITCELVSSGYDGLIYANTREGAPYDSVMILMHQQAEIVSVHSALAGDFDINDYTSV